MNSRTHLIYIVLISLVLTGWFFDRQMLGSEPTTPAITANIEQAIDNKAKLSEVKTEILGSEATSHATVANIDQAIDNKDILSEVKAEILGSEPTPDVAALLQQQVTDYTTQFYEQDYDADWSYAAKQQLTDLFAVYAKELESFDVVAIECKSSICQIKTRIDGHHFMGLMHLQKALIAQDWYGSNSETAMTTKSDGEPHEVYISLH